MLTTLAAMTIQLVTTVCALITITYIRMSMVMRAPQTFR